MDSLASNIEMIKEVQEEKSILLNQQVILMYAIFFIFLGITIALLKFLVPLLQTQAGSADSLLILQGFGTNPCSICTENPEPSCLGCTIFLGVSASFGFGGVEDPASYYRALFLTMIVVQGFFTGLIAGQISSDSLAAGAKHSLILTISGFIIYMFVVKAGLA
jgi:hypothetical protein